MRSLINGAFIEREVKCSSVETKANGIKLQSVVKHTQNKSMKNDETEDDKHPSKNATADPNKQRQNCNSLLDETLLHKQLTMPLTTPPSHEYLATPNSPRSLTTSGELICTCCG